MGSMASGSLYFDNFRVVYGDTVDDLENPVIDAVKAGAAELAGDGTTELKTNRLTLTAEFHDPAGENATGISPPPRPPSPLTASARRSRPPRRAAPASAFCCRNGTHSVTVSVCDGFRKRNDRNTLLTVNAASTAYGTVHADRRGKCRHRRGLCPDAECRWFPARSARHDGASPDGQCWRETKKKICNLFCSSVAVFCSVRCLYEHLAE